jgi:hypothetical protein
LSNSFIQLTQHRKKTTRPRWFYEPASETRSPYWDTLGVATATAPLQIAGRLCPFLVLQCVSCGPMTSDNVLGPPSVSTDRVQTLSVPTDGSLNTSSDVIRLETSGARQDRACRLRNLCGFFWSGPAIPNPPPPPVRKKKKQAKQGTPSWMSMLLRRELLIWSTH